MNALQRLTLVAIIALIGAMAVAIGWIVWSGAQSSNADEARQAASKVATDAGENRSAETTPVSFGEEITAGPLSLRVVSAGPADLPEEKPAPAAGMTRVVVVGSARNTSDAPLALNAVPYSVYNTTLTIGETTYDGGLYTGAVQLRDGEIAAGREVVLRFLFEVPKGSTEATFTWPPATWNTEDPALVLAISDVSQGSR